MLRPKQINNVLLITRVRTGNQGNQCLSMAWYELLRKAFPQGQVGMIERGAAYLGQFGISDVDPAAPIDGFERLVDAALALPLDAKPSPLHHKSVIDAIVSQPASRKFVTRLTRAGRVHRALGIAAKGYARRIALFRQMDLVVVNPAGEFSGSSLDVALAYLIEVRVAQRLGCKTALVNPSFEIENAVLQKIATYVLDHADLLEFRDDQSRLHYVAVGGKKAAIVLPDAAILTSAPIAEREPMALAVSINALHAEKLRQVPVWEALLQRLEASGYSVTLVSNEMMTDGPLYERFAGVTKARVARGDLGYIDYATMLSSFDAVITSRLHTGVLALTSGVPVVPLEPSTFKMNGFFRHLGLEVEVVETATAGWDVAVERQLAALLADRAATSAAIIEARDRARALIEATLLPAFAEL